MADVFICYKVEDKARVAQLAAACEAAGYSVAWDAKIEGGVVWRAWIDAEMALARVVIVCWSYNTVDPLIARWVLDEADAAMKASKTLLPVKLDEVPLPKGFGQIQTISLADWDGGGFHAGLLGLLFRLRDLLGEGARREPQTATKRTVRRPSTIVRDWLVTGFASLGLAAATGFGTYVLMDRIMDDRLDIERRRHSEVEHKSREDIRALSERVVYLTAQRSMADENRAKIQRIVEEAAKTDAGGAGANILPIIEILNAEEKAQFENIASHSIELLSKVANEHSSQRGGR